MTPAGLPWDHPDADPLADMRAIKETASHEPRFVPFVVPPAWYDLAVEHGALSPDDPQWVRG